MKIMRQFFPYLALCMLIVLAGSPIFASTSATITGRVTDQQELVIPDAQVQATNILTNINYAGETNKEGFYRIPNLPPGEYRVIVQKDGFASVARPGVELHVQDVITLNFAMQVGSVTQTVTVEGGTPLINTESGTVSTVVDRRLVGNLPLNGRSFQTLIQLTPGVVVTRSSFDSAGQFSVNGQRASANYFSVDGVAANIGISPTAGLSQTAAGAIPAVGVTGGTNNLVSADALQEFRIQTSTYAPEFGRTPGAQVSIVTRSGTNDFHGTLFEYFRNEVLDANDWFANQRGLPKAKLRQNDFGGVFGGPIVRSRTFFFFSYEGQRLRLPQTAITTVPSIGARQSASSAIRPFLDAYPLPNGADFGNGTAEFNATFSDESTLNASGLRVDHRLSDRLTLFGRYNYAPSDNLGRGLRGAASANTVFFSKIVTQTATLGSAWSISANANNEFRFNYSHNSGTGKPRLDNFGGASVPPDSILFPAPFSSADSQFTFGILGLQRGIWTLGKNANNVQRQLNVVDSLTIQKGKHGLKFGVDYRRLFPEFGKRDYALSVSFFTVPSVIAGSPFFLFKAASQGGNVAFHDLGIYAQDTWNAHSRLTLTYGLRWEFEPPPSTTSGPDLLAVTGLQSPSTLALAPPGTPLWKTRYGNFAPRVGLGYRVLTKRNFETVLRGGFGVFYDLATVQVGNAFFLNTLPFSISQSIFAGLTFPLTPSLAQPPPLSPLPSPLDLVSSDPNLKLPYSLQWNIAVQQAVGGNQAVSATYLGAVGRRLIMSEALAGANPNINSAQLARNGATSDYHGLQIQYQRRVAQGLQALASYTWSHSIDTGSNSAAAVGTVLFIRGFDPNINRGPSDFDVRHAFSAALTYDIPAPRGNSVMRSVLGNWSLDNIIQARTATPVIVFDRRFRFAMTAFGVVVRPDLVAGAPVYLNDPSVAGGKRLNPAAFQIPPRDPMTGFVIRQGTLPRNAIRGFGAMQWDFAVRRQFRFREQWRLQFRAEFFNVLNHPNFGNPEGDFSNPLFGRSNQMLGRSLMGEASPGFSFTPLYQIGGPRSIQFALKLDF